MFLAALIQKCCGLVNNTMLHFNALGANFDHKNSSLSRFDRVNMESFVSEKLCSILAYYAQSRLCYVTILCEKLPHQLNRILCVGCMSFASNCVTNTRQIIICKMDTSRYRILYMLNILDKISNIFTNFSTSG